MSIYEFGPFRLDAQRLLLVHDGQPLALGPKVVETLLALVEHPGEVLSKTELLDRVWPDGFVEEANLAQNIYVIRKTLKSLWDREAIATVPRRGYRFVAGVRPVSAAVTENAARAHDAPVSRAFMPRYVYAAAATFVAALVLLGGFAAGRAPTAAPATPVLSEGGARMYAMGRYYWNLRTRGGLEKSLKYFAAVTRSDPGNAVGYAGLADADAIIADYGYGTKPRGFYLQQARAYADRALRAGPQSAEAHAAVGLIEDRLKHRDVAQSEYRTAIALDPDYAPARQWYGISLLMDGRSDQAYQQLTTASKLDPLSVATVDWLSQAAYLTRRYRESIAYAHQALDLSPQRLDVYEIMGLSYEATGDYRHAVIAYRTFGKMSRQRSEAAALLAHVYATMHRFAQARRQLQIAQAAIGGHDGADPEDVVMAFIAMGQRDEALRLLENQTHRYRDDKALIALDPRMDPVRGDLRFRAFTEGPA